MNKLPRSFCFKEAFENAPIPKPVVADQMLLDAGVTLGEGKYQTLGDLARGYADLGEAHRLYVWPIIVVRGGLFDAVEMDSVVY